MRVRLAAILVVLALIILVARRAHAACAVKEAYLGNFEVPVGCKLTVYVRDPEVRPSVIAVRGDQQIDVTGAITSEPELVATHIETNRCTGMVMLSSYPLTLLSIELEGVAAGDTLALQGLTAPTIRAVVAGTCAAPVEPQLICSDDTPRRCDDELPDDWGDDGGCSTGGTPALGVVLALLSLVMRRRRR